MDIQNLIDNVDIVEYISQYTDLEERNGELWGLSPLKDENTPSFSVRPEENVFYDFSSGQGGNIISFVMAYNHCSFFKAVDILRAYSNMYSNTGDGANAESVIHLTSTQIARRFAPRKTREKKSNPKIYADDYMSRFKWDKEKLKPWFDEGISWESMRKFDVRYDQLSNRIVFPIRNMSGQIINVSGRTLDPDYKAKKLRKYTYFSGFDGGLNTLYGFYENKETIAQSNEIILFEGCKSVLKADTWGVGNTAAVLTSHLNQFQKLQIIKLGVDVVVAFDDGIDIPADRNIRKLIPYVKVYYIFDFERQLQEKDAPVDKGYEVFMDLYKKKRRLL